MAVSGLVVAALVAGCGTSAEPRAASVELDRSFDGDGVALVSFGPGYAAVDDMAVDGEGRALLLGGALVRLQSDGRLDPTFGSGGRLQPPFRFATALALQPDGRIVVVGGEGGTTSGAATDAAFALARFRDDGSLDRDFGDGGVVTTRFPSIGAVPSAVVVAGDGTIVVAGRAHDDNSSGQGGALARYLPDGTLDPAFGRDGRVRSPLGMATSPAHLTVQPDGRIIVPVPAAAGDPDPDFGLVRYTRGGELDKSFGSEGFVAIDVGSHQDAVTAVTLQGDGRIVAVGFRNVHGGAGPQFVVVRYGTDGRLDPSFGTGGITVTSAGRMSQAYDVVVQDDGGIVVAGRAADDGVGSVTNWGWALVRYRRSGVVDERFGRAGVVRDRVGHMVSGVTIDPKGRIVVAGCTCPRDRFVSRAGHESDSSFAVARYSWTN